MKPRKLASILVSALNALASQIEEEMSADEGEEGNESPPSSARAKPAKAGASSSRSRSKADENDDEKDDDNDDEPSSEDCVKAARAALKVLEKEEVTKIVKKYGKVEKSADVPADKRQAVIDALEKAVEDAE